MHYTINDVYLAKNIFTRFVLFRIEILTMLKTQIIKPKFLTYVKGNNFFPGKYNPKTFGWIRPDGVINFQTVEAAEDYAKKRCVSALNAEKPFERGVLVNDNQILADVDGDIAEVNMSDYCGKMVDASFFHGHVKLKKNPEQPLSLTDYLTMLSQGVKKVVAFNKNGEHSTLIRKPEKNRFNGFPLKYLPQEIQEILIRSKQIKTGNFVTSEYGKLYGKMFPKNLQKKMECALHSHIGYPYASNSKIIKIQDFSFEECMKVESIISQMKEDGTFQRLISNFWENISKKINCIYETNFSDLKKQ